MKNMNFDSKMALAAWREVNPKTQTRRPHDKPKYQVGDLVTVNDNVSKLIKITGVREERLQDITAYDALMEGVDLPEVINATTPIPKPEEYGTWDETRKNDWCEAVARKMYIAQCYDADNHITEFIKLWDEIYKDKPEKQWANNPKVIVYEFEKVIIDNG